MLLPVSLSNADDHQDEIGEAHCDVSAETNVHGVGPLGDDRIGEKAVKILRQLLAIEDHIYRRKDAEPLNLPFLKQNLLKLPLHRQAIRRFEPALSHICGHSGMRRLARLGKCSAPV